MYTFLEYITIIKILPLIFYIFSSNIQIKENIKKTEHATIIFVGDLMCHMPQIESAQVEGIADSFDFFETYKFVKDIISDADLAIGNLETVIAGKEAGYSGYPNFNSPVDYLKGIKNAGFDFLVASNNHSYDKGKKGLLNTIEELKKYKLHYTGIYNSVQDRDSIRIININNIKLAILSYSYGLNGNYLPKEENYLVNLIDTNLIRKDINKAKEQNVDLILTYFHFGEEYQRLPNKFQQLIVNFAIKCGSDIIIGSHPHVIQPIDFFKGNNKLDTGIVAYSLGNFISNQRKRYTDCGVILRLTIEKNDSITKLKNVEYQPTWVFKGYIENKVKYYILPNNENLRSKFLFLSYQDSIKASQALKDTEIIINKFTDKLKRI